MVTNKKAQMRSVLALIVFLFLIVATSVLVRYVTSTINDSFSTDETFATNENVQELVATSNGWWSILDQGILWVFFLLCIGLVVTSFLIPAHPVFLYINIFALPFLVFIAAIITNVYTDLVSNESIAASLSLNGSTLFTKSTWLMQYLPWICIIVVIISTVVMYSKRTTFQ